MSDAKSLLLRVFNAIPDGGKVASLFADDGVVELPFLHSLGIETRYEGPEAIAGFYDLVKQPYLPGGVAELPAPAGEIFSFDPGYRR